jgi:hypothetical protein
VFDPAIANAKSVDGPIFAAALGEKLEGLLCANCVKSPRIPGLSELPSATQSSQWS